MRKSVKHLLASESAEASVELSGWVRTRRDSKEFSFVELNDGSCLQGIQVIIDAGIPGSDQVNKMNTGASVSVVGELVESPGKGQSWEVRATEVELLGEVGPERFFQLAGDVHGDAATGEGEDPLGDGAHGHADDARVTNHDARATAHVAGVIEHRAHSVADFAGRGFKTVVHPGHVHDV